MVLARLRWRAAACERAREKHSRLSRTRALSCEGVCASATKRNHSLCSTQVAAFHPGCDDTKSVIAEGHSPDLREEAVRIPSVAPELILDPEG